MNDKGNNPSMQNRDNHSTLNKRKKSPECLTKETNPEGLTKEKTNTEWLTKETNIMNNKGINRDINIIRNKEIAVNKSICFYEIKK